MKKFVLSLMLVGGISHACPNPSLTEAAMFDNTTTFIGFNINPNATELNPIGAIGGTLIRVLLVTNEDKLDANTKVTASAVWTGAAIHNIAHLMGLSFVPSALIGILSGMAIKENNNCKKY